MRFAFDVDGVITEMPELFRVLTSALKDAGHTVIILTDFDEHFRAHRVEELQRDGIVYDELVITPRKQEYVLANGIDYAFDDDVDYYKQLKSLSLFAFSPGKT